jgi:hypothetical protein
MADRHNHRYVLHINVNLYVVTPTTHHLQHSETLSSYFEKFASKWPRCKIFLTILENLLYVNTVAGRETETEAKGEAN